MKTVSFASVGECMVELSAGKGAEWRMGFAGDTFNTAWYVRKLLPGGRRIAYVSAIGDDPFSSDMRNFIAAAGVETDRIRTVKDRRPGLYAITLNEAERAFTYWRSESAARCLADDGAWLNRALAGADMLYFSGITLAILSPAPRRRLLTALSKARTRGATIAFDPNYRPVLWPDRRTAREVVEQAYGISDVALPTFSDAKALFGDRRPEATARRLSAAGVQEFVVKNGEEPALVAAGGRLHEVSPVEAKRLVDTTGAGDSFSGAYLAGRLLDLPPPAAARLGHAVAAEVVGIHGALAKIDASRLLRRVKQSR